MRIIGLHKVFHPYLFTLLVGCLYLSGAGPPRKGAIARGQRNSSFMLDPHDINVYVCVCVCVFLGGNHIFVGSQEQTPKKYVLLWNWTTGTKYRQHSQVINEHLKREKYIKKSTMTFYNLCNSILNYAYENLKCQSLWSWIANDMNQIWTWPTNDKSCVWSLEVATIGHMAHTLKSTIMHHDEWCGNKTLIHHMCKHLPPIVV